MEIENVLIHIACFKYFMIGAGGEVQFLIGCYGVNQVRVHLSPYRWWCQEYGGILRVYT